MRCTTNIYYFTGNELILTLILRSAASVRELSQIVPNRNGN